jgi:hypothetical protein
MLAAPTFAHADTCRMPPEAMLPSAKLNCAPNQWPEVCEDDGLLRWADNGLPVPAGTTTYMIADMGGIPMGPCHWPGYKKQKAK